MQFSVLLDSPDAPQPSLQIAELGDFKDARYGEFSITEAEVQDWAKNLSLLPGGKALIDLDHLSDKPSPHRRTEAAGWITGVELADGVPRAKVEWTPVGESAIREHRYSFFSPSFGDFRDQTGAVHQNVLTGGALTNKPFLASMPQVTLASEERVQEAVEADPVSALYQLAMEGSLGEDVKTLASTDQRMRDKAVKDGHALPDGSYPIPDVAHLKAAITLAQSGHGKASAAKALIKRRAKELGATNLLPDDWKPEGKSLDSRAPMELTAITKALSLEEDADEQKVLDAIQSLQDEATKPETDEPKTLDQLAKDEGKIVLDAGEYGQLRDGAAAGIESKKQLDMLTLDTAFTKALDAGKAVAADREFYESLPLDVAVKRLEDAPQIVNVQPRGKNSTDFIGDAPDGIHEQSFQLDQAVKKHMEEHDESDYVKALHTVEDLQRRAA